MADQTLECESELESESVLCQEKHGRQCEGCRQSREVAEELSVLLSTIVSNYEEEIRRLSHAASRPESDSIRDSAAINRQPQRYVSMDSLASIPGFSCEMRKLGDKYHNGCEDYAVNEGIALKYWEAAAVCGCQESALRVGMALAPVRVA
eukprot:3226817-Rhodomonas_salina.1